jgi:hypothetical protein
MGNGKRAFGPAKTLKARMVGARWVNSSGGLLVRAH